VTPVRAGTATGGDVHAAAVFAAVAALIAAAGVVILRMALPAVCAVGGVRC